MVPENRADSDHLRKPRVRIAQQEKRVTSTILGRPRGKMQLTAWNSRKAVVKQHFVLETRHQPHSGKRIALERGEQSDGYQEGGTQMRCHNCGVTIPAGETLCPWQPKMRLTIMQFWGVIGGVIGSLVGFTFWNMAGAVVGGLVGIVACDTAARFVLRARSKA
jgi:hypothetical protein